MSLRQTAHEGNRRATLEHLRDVLAEQIDNCESARDVAALSNRLTDVLAQIDELAAPAMGDAGKPASAVDEFTKRRRERAG